MSVRTVDYHTAGEPFRIVTGLAIPGGSVPARREALRLAQVDPGAPGRDVEELRQLLCREPRGHADMYGGFIVPANDAAASAGGVDGKPSADDGGVDARSPAGDGTGHFGVLFWHNDGYSTACGHGTIALGAWAVHSGLVPAPDTGTTEVRIDVPSGRVAALVDTEAGRVSAVTFRNVPSRVVELAVPAGDAVVDLAYSGALYAVLDTAALGLAVEPSDLPELIRAGRRIKAALPGRDLYGVIFCDRRVADPAGVRQRNVTIFADGQVDRSPCGSGTSAVLALLHADGTLPEGATLRHGSIVGTEFLGRVVGEGPDGVVTEITGMAYRTGESVFDLDPADPLGTGFVLR
ncbi:proline racemase [Longispora fulva]|uniref:Proline racemase n=1 Tax=Longispora fulva TaxID=619741 RepID=A0A8J7GA22_9ACTN|nr:proline racemase family protein [Longispora fulva]MBG6135185.1 proline racemase [Longispora fulva]GIG56580.1 proline racemase [Longispora fulva]